MAEEVEQMEMDEPEKETKKKEEKLDCKAAITFSKEDKVGFHDGSRKPVVYKGQFNGEIPIAIKAYQKTGDDKEFQCVKRNLEILSSAHNRHPNFIRYYGEAEDKQFKYLATELCECSVAGLIARNEKTHILDHLSHKEILRQSAKAVQYLHGLKPSMIHRNLHPENFLIAQISDRDYLVKLTDFHCTKDWKENPNQSGTRASDGWIAPDGPETITKESDDEPGIKKQRAHGDSTAGGTSSEFSSQAEALGSRQSRPSGTGKRTDQYQHQQMTSIAGATKRGREADAIGQEGRHQKEKEPDEDPRTDVFILGCFFYYVLSGGKHPFGSSAFSRVGNIANPQYEVYAQHWEGSSIGVKWGVSLSGGKNPFGGPKDNKEGYIKDWQNASPWWKREAFSALNLIKKLMIRFDNSKRQSMDQILSHPYFNVLDHPDPYKIYESGKKPGLCIIVSQEKFHQSWSDLPGMKFDAERLTKTFGGFGYDVLLYKNLTAQQMRDWITPGKLNDLGQYNSLVVCILSHGDKGTVQGVDGQPVIINELKYAFNGGSCEALKDQPKIFIILACQGCNAQKAHPSSVTTARSITTVQYLMQLGDDQPPLIHHLSLMSTIEEFYAFGNPYAGSTFIRALCDQLQSEYGRVQSAEDEGKTRDLLQLFHSEVIPRVASEKINPDGNVTCKQTPESRSSLLRTIRFRRQAEKSPTVVKPQYDGASGANAKMFQQYRDAQTSKLEDWTKNAEENLSNLRELKAKAENAERVSHY